VRAALAGVKKRKYEIEFKLPVIHKKRVSRDPRARWAKNYVAVVLLLGEWDIPGLSKKRFSPWMMIEPAAILEVRCTREVYGDSTRRTDSRLDV
jgi:hypothetical protein